MKPTAPSKYFHSDEWAFVVANYLRKRKKLRNLTYKAIAAKLNTEFGIEITPGNLKQRFNSGRLGAQLFVCSVLAMGETDIKTKDFLVLYEETASQKE